MILARKFLGIAIGVAISQWPVEAAIAQEHVQLPLLKSTYAQSILWITFTGRLFNEDVKPDVLEGNAFLISESGYALTASHVVPSDLGRYKTFSVEGRFGKSAQDVVRLGVVDRDSDNDIVLLKIASPKQYAAIPLAVPSSVSDGMWLGTLGFQGGVDSDSPLLDDGVLRSSKGRRWITSVSVNPGGSGAPLFNSDGRVVAVATSALRIAEQIVRGKVIQIPIEKTNYASTLPTDAGGLLARNGLAEKFGKAGNTQVASVREIQHTIDISETAHMGVSAILTKDIVAQPGYRIVGSSTKFPAVSGLTTSVDIKPFGSTAELTTTMACPECDALKPSKQFDFTGLFITKEVRSLPPTIERSYTVSQIKDDHPIVLAPDSRNYEQDYPAEPGYKISRARFVETSGNKVNSISISPIDDGRKVRIAFRLTSGPLVDQWRGWLFGAIVTDQTLIQPSVQ